MRPWNDWSSHEWYGSKSEHAITWAQLKSKEAQKKKDKKKKDSKAGKTVAIGKAAAATVAIGKAAKSRKSKK